MAGSVSPVGQIVIGAPRQMLEPMTDGAEDLSHSSQNLDGLGRDVLPDAVTGHNGNIHSSHPCAPRTRRTCPHPSAPARTCRHRSAHFDRHRHAHAAADAQRGQARARRPGGGARAAASRQCGRRSRRWDGRARWRRRSRSAGRRQWAGRCRTASTCAANASFNSTRSKSADAQPGPLLKLLHRGHRADAHDARIDTGARPAGNRRERAQPAGLGELGRGQHQRRSAIGDSGGRARR